MEMIQIGRVGRPHGVQGEVSVDAGALTASEIESIGTLQWQGRGETRTLRVASARPAARAMLVHFHGIRDRDQASLLTLGTLHADRTRLPDAGPGQAYWFELVGLAVVDLEGRHVGTLVEVLGNPAHPIYRVQGEKEMLVPGVAPIVRRVDLAARIVEVDLPKGLEDL